MYTFTDTYEKELLKEKYLLFERQKPYFRIRVPSDLIGVFEQKAIKRLIPSSTRSSILQFRNMLVNQANTLFSILRKRVHINKAELLELIDTHIDKAIESLKLEFETFIEEQFPHDIYSFINKHKLDQSDLSMIEFLFKQHKRTEILRSALLSKQEKSKTIQTEELIHQIKGKRNNTFIRLLAKYIHEQRWQRTYRKEVVAGFRLFLYEIDSLDLISNNSLNLFLNQVLLKYPKNASMKKETKDLSIKQRLECSHLEKLSHRTIEKHIQWYNQFLKWLHQNEYIDQLYLIKTPKRKNNTSAHERRKQYCKGDIKALFDSPLFKDPTKYKLHQRYIPIIALYSGMRLQEVCQLEHEDIVKVDGVLCFSINSKSNNGIKKWVKSHSGHRLIPIHSKLFELGIVDHLKRFKKGKVWLELKADKNGKYNSTYGKQFQRINNRYINKSNEVKSFHSFRHTFAYTLKQVGVDEVKIGELLGHSKKSVTSIYTKRFSPKILKKEIERLRFIIDI